MDGEVLVMDGKVLAMDGEVLAPDGEVLDIGWCSTGSRMGQFWSGNAAGKIENSFGKK